MEALAVVLMIFSIVVFGLRSYKFAIGFYTANAFCLVSLFFVLAMRYGANELYFWAIAAFITKVILVPCVLFWTLKKINLEFENEPYCGFFLSPVIAFGFGLGFALLLEPVFIKFALIKEQIIIISAIFCFWVGVCGFVLRRSFLKQILSYCLIENAIHLNLATNAYNAHSLVEIGILSDAVFAICVMCALAFRFKEVFGSQNVNLACDLKG